MRPGFAVVIVLSVVTSSTGQESVSLKQTEAGKKAIAKIQELGGLAMELAQNDSRLEVSYYQKDPKFSEAYLLPLKDLNGLAHLNLRGQPVTDDELALIKDSTSLTELHLENTKVTDKGMPYLKGLINLQYLNLYGTNITDAGLANLEGMKKLRHLYLWQTKVTEAGATRLKKALPGLDINLGYREPPPKPEAKAAAKKPA
jgi:Leucine rich repeat